MKNKIKDNFYTKYKIGILTETIKNPGDVIFRKGSKVFWRRYKEYDSDDLGDGHHGPSRWTGGFQIHYVKVNSKGVVVSSFTSNRLLVQV